MATNGTKLLYLAEWREHRGLTQEMLAEKMDTTPTNVSRHETGDRKSNAEYLAWVAEVLDCRPADLFRDPKQPSAEELLADVMEVLRTR